MNTFVKIYLLYAVILGLKPNITSSLNQVASGNPVVIATWDSGKEVCEEAWKILSLTNGRALDAVERGAIYIENSTNCCVGLGGYPDREGKVTLDACIMDENANIGAVAFLERIKNPISVARAVMEKSPHALLVGEGAQLFAIQNGFPLEEEKLSEAALHSYQEWLQKSAYKPMINVEQTPYQNTAPPSQINGKDNHDTMALLAMDDQQNLSGACTTSGIGFKMRGRVGDSPIIGAGLYVDNAVGAASATGLGEEILRIAGSHLVVELMRQGHTPKEACRIACQRIVDINPEKALTFQVAFIAINKKGDYGAYAIQEGFTYAIKQDHKSTQILPAASIF